MTPKKHQAIQTALLGDWKKAIKLNQEILQEEPADIDSLNRIAFAYTAIGRLDEAKKFYRRVLHIDPGNPIARKNLQKIENNTPARTNTVQISASMFLEETGKTKVVHLTNLAPVKVLRDLQVGQEVILCIKRSKVFVLNDNDEFIGMLPDATSKRLIEFITGGNDYAAWIRSLEKNTVAIFVREKKRSPKFKNQPSF